METRSEQKLAPKAEEQLEMHVAVKRTVLVESTSAASVAWPGLCSYGSCQARPRITLPE
jgi:hypothetical protein